jgi:hypothetical protein
LSAASRFNCNPCVLQVITQVVRKKVHCLSPRLPERIECRSARRKELSAGPRAICCGARFEFEAHNG